MYTHTCKYIHTYTHQYTHTHTYTHTYMYTHTCKYTHTYLKTDGDSIVIFLKAGDCIVDSFPLYNPLSGLECTYNNKPV